LLYTVGKILEKLLIESIKDNIHKTVSLNDNQYGYTPQKKTINKKVGPRNVIESQLQKGREVITVSLYVKVAFDSAWWPAILQGLRETNCL
jgi:predicted metallo-beta-lactamase superfamily hydrolase